MDIAALGLSVDSGPLSRAVQELRQVPAAARSAAAGADQVVGAAERMARAMTQSTAAANQNVRALQVVGSASRAAMQQMANSFAGVRDFPTESPIAYGRALDELRAKYNPLFAAGRQYRETLQDINVALKMGAISEKERSEAIARTKAEFAGQVAGINATSAALRGNANALRAVAIQIPDVIQGIAMGQSGFQIFTQQGLQTVQVLGMQPGGIGGAFKELGKWAGAFLTPARLAAGGILAIGTAALTAAVQYQSAQRQMSTSLLGSGRASGATVGDLNQAASAGASTFGLSISEAREFAATLAQTGKIGVEEIGKIVKVGHDVATVYGIDAKEAAGLLAQSFADPVRGAEKLNERLGFLSARMQSDIASLVAQNRLYDAQRLLLSGVASGVEGAQTSLSGMAKGWAAVGNAISNAWNKLGEWTSRALNMVPPETDQRIDDLRRELESVGGEIEVQQHLLEKGYGSNALDEAIVKQQMLRDELGRLVAQQEKYTQSVKETQANINSLRISDAAKKYSPEIEQRRVIESDAKALKEAFEEINRTGGENSELLKRLGMSYEEFATSMDRAKGAAKEFKGEYEKTIASLKLDISAVGAKGPAALGNIAYQRSLLQSGSNSSEAVAKAELDRTLAIKQAQQQILDTQNARLLSSRQATEMAQMELSVLGKSVGEQEAMRGKLAARQQLEQEALQTYGSRDAYDRAHLASLEKEVEKQAAIKQLLAEQQLKRDVKFQTETLFMSPGDQQIASTLRNAYGDNKWKSEMDGALAQQMRMNNALVEAKNAAVDFTTSMVEGLAKGEDMAHVLNNALQQVGSTLIRVGVQTAVAGAATGNPAAAGMGLIEIGVGAAISYFASSKQKADQAAQATAQAAQQLAEAQKQWASMAGQVSNWIKEWTTGFSGELSKAIDSARSQMQQFADAAAKAQNSAGVAAAQNAFNEGVNRSIIEAIKALGDYGSKSSDTAKAIEEVNDKAKDLTDVLIEFGTSAADAADVVNRQLNYALGQLVTKFTDDLARKINDLVGGGWVNQLNDLVSEVVKLRQDAASLGVQTSLIDTYYVLAAQQVIDNNKLTGDSFNAVALTLGPLGSQLHEFSAAVEDTAQAVKRSTEQIQQAIQGYQDQLFVLQQDQQTLAGTLAVFDLQAQRAREEEIRLGGQALTALEALQAQQRLNIIADFNKRALEEQQRADEERLRQQQQAAEEQKRIWDEAAKFLQGALQNIQNWISSFLAGSQSPLSPSARLASAQSTFSTQYSAALGGDRDALSGITGNAQSLVEAIRAVYGSTTAGQTLINSMLSQLQSLPSQVSPEQFIINELKPAVEATTTSVSAVTSAVHDMQIALQSALNSSNPSAIASALSTYFSQLDTNVNGLLDYNEFVGGLHGMASDSALAQMFKTLDIDNSGSLSRLELLNTATGNVNTSTQTVNSSIGGVKTDTTSMATSLLALAQISNNTGTTSTNTANTYTTLLTISATLTNISTQIGNAGAQSSLIGFLDRIRSNQVSEHSSWGAGYAATGSVYAGGSLIPSFGAGGYVDGPSHYYGGRNINVEGGEYVINKQNTARFRGVLDQINFGHRAPSNDNTDIIQRLDRLERAIVGATMANAEIVSNNIADLNKTQTELNKRTRVKAAAR